MDIFPPAKQRPTLLALRDALGCRDNALRRDECGDRRINGKHGHIYAVPGTLEQPTAQGFLIYYSGPEHIGSARGWGFAKRAFQDFGCTVTQDGDDNGAVFLDRLPTPGEAAIIRDKLHIAKKRESGEEELARLRRHALEHRFQAKKPASDNMAGLMAADGSEGKNYAP